MLNLLFCLSPTSQVGRHNVRQSPGRVRDAIINFLDVRSGEASVEEILQGVRGNIENVSPSSIRSYLSLNTPVIFQRTTRGRYQLSNDGKQGEHSAHDQLEPVVISGNAKLYETDCFTWFRDRVENSIHAVVTDPPYGLVEYSKKEQEKLRNGQGGIWRIPPSYDGHQRSPLPRFTTLTPSDLNNMNVFFTRWAKELMRVLVPGAHVFVASNPLVCQLVACALSAGGLEARGTIVRLVMTMRGGDRPKNAHKEFSDVSVMPRSMWEPWLLFRKPVERRVQDNLRKWKTGGLRRFSKERPFGDVIKSHPTRTEERRIAPHPSLKPQAFLRQIVQAALPLGEGVILDTFAGSGSTLAAAEAVGYESIGVELDPEYVKIAKGAIPKLAKLTV